MADQRNIGDYGLDGLGEDLRCFSCTLYMY